MDGHQAVELARERLTREHPFVAPARIAIVLAECYRQTEGARIQAYRVLFAERAARQRLVIESTTAADVGAQEEAG